MADTNAYIQKLMDKEGNDIYPITTASAVFVQTKDGDVVSQQTLSAKLSSMESSFQAGCDALVNKLKELGVTPASSSPTDIAAAMDTLATNKYNAGVSAADARVNKSSKSYSQGVTDADARANSSSANWKDGYNNGYSAGRAQGQADVKANPGGYGLITQDAYNNYGTTCYNNGVAAGKNAVNGSVTASCNWSKDEEGGDGTRAATSGSASATASISNGKLSISVSGSSSGTAWRWIGDSWTSQKSCSSSSGGSNSKQLT